jgi:hypothetical protein
MGCILAGDYAFKIKILLKYILNNSSEGDANLNWR